MHYALTRYDLDSPYQVYGKGDDAAQAERDATSNIETAFDADLLRQNLIVLTREESEHQGYVVPGAPVIWHDELRHYRVEDHGPYRPRGIEQRIRDRAR